jgi:phage tail-like protein
MAIPGVNAAFSAGTSLLGIRNDPYKAYNFLVEIEGLIVGGFSEVTGMQVEIEVKDYREGGVNEYIHKLPGSTRYPQNLVLKHGLTDIDLLWQWFVEVSEAISAGKPFERKNGSIFLLDDRGLPAMWWNFLNAYPVKWSGPDFRADSANVAVEAVELVHQGIVKPKESTALSAARGIAGAAGVGGLL